MSLFDQASLNGMGNEAPEAGVQNNFWAWRFGVW